MDGASFVNFFPIIGISFIFYFLIIRPQQKKAKETADMLSHLKIDDSILLQSGIYGFISELEKDKSFCKIEISKNTIIKIEKSEIVKIIKDN